MSKKTRQVCTSFCIPSANEFFDCTRHHLRMPPEPQHSHRISASLYAPSISKVTGAKVQTVKSMGQDVCEQDLLGAVLGFVTRVRPVLGRSFAPPVFLDCHHPGSSRLCAHIQETRCAPKRSHHDLHSKEFYHVAHVHTGCPVIFSHTTLTLYFKR